MVRLYLLRHGEVASHKGDVPVTPDGERHARDVGAWLGEQQEGPIRLLSGETRRAMDTAHQVALGIREAGGSVTGPEVAFALRNPDLYVGGVRVNMVSSAEALAEQVPGLNAAEVDELAFFPEFFVAPDRVGWWLTHETPPGETAGDLARRTDAFIASLWDVEDHVVVAVTHSPLLRAVGLDRLGRDIGEPPWVAGLILEGDSAASLATSTFEPEPA